MFTPSAKVRLAVAAAFLLAVAVGCEKELPPITSPLYPVNTPERVEAVPLRFPGEQTVDNRSYWAYNGGHLAQGAGETWFEQTPEVVKADGKPWELREVSRSKEHIELYDASRAVTVRLSGTEMQARWDKDGKDAEWKTLQKGKWGKPE